MRSIGALVTSAIQKHEGLRIFASTCLGLICFSFVVALAVQGYKAIDESGWILHHHATPVSLDGDWLVGEFRDCRLLTTTPPIDGTNYSSEALASLPHLFCMKDEANLDKPATPHILLVEYWGRLTRPTKFINDWKCQRKEDRLICKAIN